MRDQVGVVYLIHMGRPLADTGVNGFSRPVAHYLGFAVGESAERRVAEHQAGRGAKILAACVRAGIEFRLVRTWPAMTRTDERRLKRRREAPVLCPVCRPARLAVRAAWQRAARAARRARESAAVGLAA